MKIPPKIYAEVILDSIRNKKSEQIPGVMKKIVKILSDNYDLSKEKKIISFFAEIWDKENEIVEAEVVSARKIDSKTIVLIEKYIKENTGAKKVIITEKEDKSIIGGFIFRFNNMVVDDSMRAKINNLKRNMIK